MGLRLIRGGWSMSHFFEQLEAWERYMLARGMSSRTIDSYGYWITKSHQFCKVDPEKMTEADVINFLASKSAFGPTRGSIAQALKCFYVWATANGVCKINPMAILQVKTPKSPPVRAVRKEDLDKLMASALLRGAKRYHSIRLCYGTGARLESLVKIRPEDVDLNEGKVYLYYTKGQDPYSVSIGPKTLESAEWLVHEHVPNDYGTLLGIKAGTLWMWVNQASKDAGLVNGAGQALVHPHTLRHSFATHQLENGVNVRVVQRRLNHKSLAVTERYLDATDENEKKAADGF